LLAKYLESASEDELIAELLLPQFRMITGLTRAIFSRWRTTVLVTLTHALHWQFPSF